MTSHLPAKLKSADISRFALRASQLETARPVIAYWCEYWIVNQLIARGLHTADDQCLKYTTTLMDKLEQTKAQYSSEAAIVDDTAGQAYVEQFGLETFERADRAVQADRVTKQTADTFLAASTFLELLNIWGEPDTEITAKIRYAKWNAVRIMKAIKEGSNPNESNPKPEPTLQENLQPLDPDDPEVKQISGGTSMQASVEEVPDELDGAEVHLAAKLTREAQPSARPSSEPSASPDKFEPVPRNGFPDIRATDNEVSPMEPSPHNRHGSVGGGYFPEVPSETRSSVLPSAPTGDDLGITPSPAQLPSPSQISPSHNISEPSASPDLPPQDYYRTAIPPPAPPASHPAPSFAHQPAHSIPVSIPPQKVSASNQTAGKPIYNTDDIAVAKAQKHARWAISALNFEDADTAVRELRAALETLGA